SGRGSLRPAIPAQGKTETAGATVRLIHGGQYESQKTERVYRKWRFASEFCSLDISDSNG
ncbi:MAG: hypothetical protein J6B53_12570, partial [Clostridia bacterium]|nr:hypothetical protein [Clostridia bacterium]